MNHDEMALQIIEATGGAGNILAATHCYTRLRLKLNNTTGIEEKIIKAIPGVLGLVIHGKEYQIVIGPEVGELYRTFVRKGDFEDVSDVKKDEKETTQEGKLTIKSAITWILDFIGGVFSPVIPVLIAGGLTGAVLAILNKFLGVSEESGTYTVLYAVNQAAFYFLPVFIGFSGAKKLNVNGYLGAFLGTVLLYSTINAAEGLSFLSIPIQTVTYSTTVFPIILGVIFMSFVYKGLAKVLPKSIRTIFLPLGTMIITVPITLIIFGPIGGLMGNLLSAGVYNLYEAVGPLAVMVIGAATPLLVFFGMNNALYPIIFAFYAAQNSDPLVGAGMLASNLAVFGACLAVGLRAKDKQLKGVGLSTAITAMCGITEPGVYGILIPLRKPMIAALIGGGIGGLVCGLFQVAKYTMGTPSVISLVLFIPNDGSGMNNFYYAILVAAVSAISGFVAAWILGFKEEAKA